MGRKKTSGPTRFSVLAFVSSGACLIVLGIFVLLRGPSATVNPMVSEAKHRRLEAALQARREAMYRRSYTPRDQQTPERAGPSAANYSWDVSWPIHSRFPEDVDFAKCEAIQEEDACETDAYALKGNCAASCHEDHFKRQYGRFIQGCYAEYSRMRCRQVDDQRIGMNVRQPPRQNHFTELGFLKTKVPPALWEKITYFWRASPKAEKDEDWPSGNIYVNHWDVPTYMVNLEDKDENAPGISGWNLKRLIWKETQPMIEAWTGKKLTQTSLYGIRVYHEGAILSPHCDRLPLVSSAIINVDQDVDEPWPLEIYDHSGQAHNVTMEPGDMVLYESHVCVHGRPFPLKGRYFANLFVHFEPVDHSNNKEPKRLRTQD